MGWLGAWGRGGGRPLCGTDWPTNLLGLFVGLPPRPPPASHDTATAPQACSHAFHKPVYTYVSSCECTDAASLWDLCLSRPFLQFKSLAPTAAPPPPPPHPTQPLRTHARRDRVLQVHTRRGEHAGVRSGVSALRARALDAPGAAGHCLCTDAVVVRERKGVPLHVQRVRNLLRAVGVGHATVLRITIGWCWIVRPPALPSCPRRARALGVWLLVQVPHPVQRSVRGAQHGGLGRV
jgi:hypothetical protein